MKRMISAASEPDSKLDETTSSIQDDFDYIIDGLDKLDRSGKSDTALQIALKINNSLQAILSEIASAVQE